MSAANTAFKVENGLYVVGDGTVANSLFVNNNLTVNTTLVVNTVNSSIIPTQNVTFTLGNSTVLYADFYTANGTSQGTFTSNVFHVSTANVSSSLLPNANGIPLGNTTRRWDTYTTAINATGAVSIGNTLATGNTTITGFANVSTSLQVGTTASIAGTLGAGNTTVTGFANVTSTLQVGNNTTIAGTLGTGNTTVTGFANVSTSLQVGTTANIAGTLGTGNTTVTGFANVTSTLQVGNNTTIAGTLGAGNTTVTGFANVTSTLQVTGVATFSNNANVAGTLGAGNTTVTGSVNISSTLATGNTVVTGFVNVHGTSATFNALTGVANTTEVITTASNHGFANGDLVRYVVSTGNTAIAGLTNGTTYYVVGANATTGMQLSATYGGSAINLTAGTSETGHTLIPVRIVFDNATGDINSPRGLANVGSLRVLGTIVGNGAVTIGNTLAAGNTTITGFANVSTSLQVGTTASIAGTLGAGNTTVTGFANVTGTGQFGGTLAAGNTTVTGFANVTSTLQVTGVATFSNNANIAGTLGTGNTTVTGFANVTGTGQFGGTLAAGNTTVTGSATVSGTLATGNTVVTGFVNVHGTSATFNALTGVANTTEVITTTSNHGFANGDLVRYVVSAGNTAISGLVNGTTYYVVGANATTGMQLSTSYGGSAINLTAGTSEAGHTLIPVRILLDDVTGDIDSPRGLANVGSLRVLGTIVGNGAVTIGNTLAAGNTTVTGFVNVSSTLATGNATVTGFANVTGTLQVGNNTTIAGTLGAGNTTITGSVNVSSVAGVGNTTVTGFVVVRSTNATFNALTGVANTTEVITTASNHGFANGDLVRYIVATGNTAIGGLTNNTTYYVVSANATTGLSLSTTWGGTAINITAGTSETGHTLVPERFFFDDSTGSIFATRNTSYFGGLRVYGAAVVNGATTIANTLTAGNTSISETLTVTTSGVVTINSTATNSTFATLTFQSNNTLFLSNVTFDTDLLFLDAVNNRIGIKNAAPSSVDLVTIGAGNVVFNTTNTALRFLGATSTQNSYVGIFANSSNSRFVFATFDTSNSTSQSGGYIFYGVANSTNTYSLMSLNNYELTYKSGNVTHAGNFGIYNVSGTRVGP